jgi:chromate reductase
MRPEKYLHSRRESSLHPARSKTFLLTNGSRAGSAGSMAVLMNRAATLLEPHGAVRSLTLADGFDPAETEDALKEAAGVVVGTGTYWDSWGSPLQRFLEVMTYTEGSSCWLGKPAGVIVTMHSVGGKVIVSRLQGVLNTLGAIIPPMSGLVYSALAQAALKAGENSITDDVWRPSDVESLCHNIVEAGNGTNKWRAWPVERENYEHAWLADSAE